MKNLINWDALMPIYPCAGGHDEHMKNLFRGATVLAHWSEDEYQGSVATAVKLEDGRFAYYSDLYGSCSECDAWEDADDKQVRTLCEELADRAKTFDTMDAMLASLDAEKEQFADELAKVIRSAPTTVTETRAALEATKGSE